MNYQKLCAEFTKKNSLYDKNANLRGIGIEMELPIVTQTGEAVDIVVIQKMFAFLKRKNFELKRDKYSNYILSASKKNVESAKNFDYNIDTITTDTGCCTLEIVLAPQNNLHSIKASLAKIIDLLTTYFDTQNCKILGYGIQPITPPARQLLMPKERYLFFEKFSPNHIIPKSKGADAHLLTITASSQCHIQVDKKETIDAVNVLNAFAGLQIILHANSPIWNGKIDTNYKATREAFWKYCYPDRLNQMEIPPKFSNIEHYLRYLLHFKPMLIKRDRFLQILNQPTFKDFMLNETPTIAQTLQGEKRIVQPKMEDIFDLNAFCYFNARLAPQYGTIESRMCCQQPPNASLAPTAATLGILTNLEEAKKMMENYSWQTWKQIRVDALKHTFKTSINGESITPLVSKFLEVAKAGLLKRNLGEEIFLEPLYQRLNAQQSPADKAIAIFETEGMQSLLKRYAFKRKTSLKIENKKQLRQTQN